MNDFRSKISEIEFKIIKLICKTKIWNKNGICNKIFGPFQSKIKNIYIHKNDIQGKNGHFYFKNTQTIRKYQAFQIKFHRKLPFNLVSINGLKLIFRNRFFGKSAF